MWATSYHEAVEMGLPWPRVVAGGDPYWHSLSMLLLLRTLGLLRLLGPLRRWSSYWDLAWLCHSNGRNQLDRLILFVGHGWLRHLPGTP